MVESRSITTIYKWKGISHITYFDSIIATSSNWTSIDMTEIIELATQLEKQANDTIDIFNSYRETYLSDVLTSTFLDASNELFTIRVDNMLTHVIIYS